MPTGLDSRHGLMPRQRRDPIAVKVNPDPNRSPQTEMSTGIVKNVVVGEGRAADRQSSGRRGDGGIIGGEAQDDKSLPDPRSRPPGPSPAPRPVEGLAGRGVPGAGLGPIARPRMRRDPPDRRPPAASAAQDGPLYRDPDPSEGARIEGPLLSARPPAQFPTPPPPAERPRPVPGPGPRRRLPGLGAAAGDGPEPIQQPLLVVPPSLPPLPAMPSAPMLPDGAFGTSRSTQIRSPNGLLGDVRRLVPRDASSGPTSPTSTSPCRRRSSGSRRSPTSASPSSTGSSTTSAASRTSTPPSAPSSASAGSRPRAGPTRPSSSRTRASSSTSSAPSSPGSTPSGSSPPPTTGPASR